MNLLKTSSHPPIKSNIREDLVKKNVFWENMIRFNSLLFAQVRVYLHKNADFSRFGKKDFSNILEINATKGDHW